MADPNEGMLDDIGEETGADAPAPPDTSAQDAPPETGAQEQETASAEGDDKPAKPNPAKSAERPDGYVPREALHQERQRANLYEQRLNQIIERYFKQQDDAGQKAATDDDPKPDYTQDPLGYLAWKDRQEQRETEQRVEQQKQWEQQQRAEQEFADTLNRARARFAKVVETRPEVGELYQAVQNRVGQMYAERGYPAHQIPALIQRYEADVIRWARQEYIPIEEALEQAAAQFGVQVPKSSTQKPTPDRDPATGQFTAAEADKAAKARESAERNVSLGSAPGAPVKPMDAKELAKMSEEDMWNYFENVGRKAGSKDFDRRMGFR